ncbi:MAG: nucleotidyltransferase domain-containing protein [Bacteroidetes bacterium]|nr:MAG: nucleotidyltransferase domain-containing protein [Bacteroidota bacterium]TAE72702.1 MAG: nucleotidyltransferase domain-containing protein [Bacteroidota bacterium]
MEQNSGLTQTELAIISEVLKRYPQIQHAYLFGSRAKGNYHTGSDVDIAVAGASIPSNVIRTIHYWLNEETPMPYKFDVVNIATISEVALQEHIQRVGKLFYSK